MTKPTIEEMKQAIEWLDGCAKPEPLWANVTEVF